MVESDARCNTADFSYRRYVRSQSQAPSAHCRSRRLRVKVAKPIRDYRTRPLMRLPDVLGELFRTSAYVYSSGRLRRSKCSLVYEVEGKCTPVICCYTLCTTDFITPCHLIGQITNSSLVEFSFIARDP